MASVVQSPNMNLPVPVVGTDVGPDWAMNINACLSILDQHNHTTGQGVPITPSGLNISSDLSFLGNSATNLKSTVFTAQTAFATLAALYVKGVDLYFNDGSGNAVQITTGGAVNATSSGITNGTASASFVSSVLVVNAASTTPANIKGGSLLLGNNTAGSHYLTLAPPNAMGADYGLVLPAIPAANNTIVTIDTSGNIGSSVVTDNSTLEISSNTLQVKASGIDTAQLKFHAVTKDKTAPLGQQISLSCLGFGTTSGSFTGVTNLSVTITTTGRPVSLALIPDSNSSFNSLIRYTTAIAGTANIAFFNGSSQMTNSALVTSTSNLDKQALYLAYVDTPLAGTYTYNVQAKVTTGTLTVDYFRLIAYEL